VGILALQEMARAVAEEPACDWMVGIAAQLDPPPVLDGGEDLAGIRAVPVAGRPERLASAAHARARGSAGRQPVNSMARGYSEASVLSPAGSPHRPRAFPFASAALRSLSSVGPR